MKINKKIIIIVVIAVVAIVILAVGIYGITKLMPRYHNPYS